MRSDVVLAADGTNWDYCGHGQTPVAASGDYSLATHADDLAP